MVEEINEINYEIDYYNSEKDENLKSVLNIIQQIFEKDKYDDNLILNKNIINNNKIYDIPLMFFNKKKINNKSCFLYLIKKYIKSSKNNENTLLYLLKLFYNNLNFKPKNYHEFFQYLSKKLYYKSKFEIDKNILNRILNIIKIIYNIDGDNNEENIIEKNFFFIRHNKDFRINLKQSDNNYIKRENNEKNQDKKKILFEISFAFKINKNILKKKERISILKFKGIRNNGDFEIYRINNLIKINDDILIELNDEELKNIIQFSILLSNTKKIGNFVIINSKLLQLNKIIKFNDLEIDILSNDFLGKIYYIFGIYDNFDTIEKNKVMSNFFKFLETKNNSIFLNFFMKY